MYISHSRTSLTKKSVGLSCVKDFCDFFIANFYIDDTMALAPPEILILFMASSKVAPSDAKTRPRDLRFILTAGVFAATSQALKGLVGT